MLPVLRVLPEKFARNILPKNFNEDSVGKLRRFRRKTSVRKFGTKTCKNFNEDSVGKLRKILPQNSAPKLASTFSPKTCPEEFRRQSENSQSKLEKAAPQKILHSSALQIMKKILGASLHGPRQSATSIRRSQHHRGKNASVEPLGASAPRVCASLEQGRQRQQRRSRKSSKQRFCLSGRDYSPRTIVDFIKAR